MNSWLEVHEGTGPVIVSFPHTGTDLGGVMEGRFVSTWLARRDADWWVDRLYDFVSQFGATTIRTRISRTVIDVNRDPSGASLYPGLATTELCPTTTFDGDPIYRPDCLPHEAEIAARREQFFEPYHRAIASQITRLRNRYAAVVLYDAHSIRSRIPRLFGGLLPHFNIGTYGGASCDPGLTREMESRCNHPAFSRVTNGRFKGGWTSRRYGNPAGGVHAVQMELAMRGYVRERDGPVEADSWPPPYDPEFASPIRAILRDVVQACDRFARTATERNT